ncbi:helix-turn-helix domain-containing protein [Streptomyces virginiae]|uniref:helix-turn-helix domain-containing protein n=1 Tax=Streptomyces virginiae TaxID=1961 RepID=UPI0036A170E9
MNTTTAAAEAKVTVATIRTWARRGVIAAVKTAGRWVIDATSLARRIAIGARRKATAFVLTADHCIALGGRRWQKNDMDRVYINGWLCFADGIDIDYYGTGNVAGFSIDGDSVANGRAGRVINAIDKVYFDAADGRLYFKHEGADHIEMRYLDGGRGYINLIGRVSRGIHAAAAAL